MTSKTFNNAFNVMSVFMWPGSGNNYAYVVTDLKTKDAAIIDPAEPTAASAALDASMAENSSVLKAIVNTHHHNDHAGGNAKMLDKYGALPVYGGADCAKVTNVLRHGDSFRLGDVKFTALRTPCHTQDSVCWYVTSPDGPEGCVFTGDTLFHGGCGRFFEGSAAEMNTALNEVLAKLPGNTVVYPGHEYTASNWKFATTVFGADVPTADALRPTEKVTCGSRTIGQEQQYNPFMMVTHPVLQRRTGETDPIAVMARLRAMKDRF